MNRKKTSKIQKAVTDSVAALSPFDDPINWLVGDAVCPWTDAQLADYQKKIDSAFGAENALVLAWSGDRKYWDEFYTDWHANGLPKGALEKKPMLLFKEVPINDRDYVYISCPRFLILERLHASQLESSWADSSWTDDNESIGGRKQIRADKPPKDFYQVLRTIAAHEKSVVAGEMRPCCERLWESSKSICYGKFRPPSEDDLIFVRRIRENMDRDGVVQRNDTERSQRIVERASVATKYFIQRSAERRRSAVRELILGDPSGYMVDVMKNHKIDLSAKEIDSTLKEAFNRQEEQIQEKI